MKMWLHRTYLAGVTFGTFAASTGQLIRSRPTANITPQHVVMAHPPGVQVLNTRPTSVTYRGRWYESGSASDDLLVDENFRLLRQGILPGTQVPVLAAGAGPGPTGSCRVAYCFYDEDTDEYSPLSGWSNTVALANQARAITNLPTTAQDARVTHIVLVVEIDGGTPKESTRRQIGVSAVTENVATLALGQPFDIPFERMPRGTITAIYHDRLAKAGDAHNPDVVYVSAPFKPERYEGLSFKTRNGEPIVAMAASGLAGVLLVLTPNRPYVLRGWTEDDMVFEPLPDRIGAFNPQSIVAIEGNIWIVGPESIYLFNGSFHNVLLDRMTEWQERVKADRAIYEAGFCCYDPNDRTFEYITHGYTETPSWIPNPDSVPINTVKWTADYTPTVPEISGTFAQPDWFVDCLSRAVESAALLVIPGGRRGDLYYGSCDGFSRVKDPDDDDDDGDLYGKRWWVRTAHYLMGDPGGDVEEGKTLERAWSYMESELKAWTFYARGGDEKAYLQLLPDNVLYWWKNDVAASLKQEIVDSFNVSYAPKTVHPHVPSRCSGRGFTFDWTCHKPLRVRNSGIGGVYRRGPASRGVVSRTSAG